jgi:hypothetical protein
LGIKVIWNHPHCPKENAFVERCNGLVATWGDPSCCPHFVAWQEQCAWLATTQRERYPAKMGKTRLEAYPKLRRNPRIYTSGANGLWNLQHVRDYLAQGRWPRWVSKIGQITLYGKPYRVGRDYVRQQVWLRFDAATNEWIIQNADGKEIIRHYADQITQERICALQVAQPRPPSNKRKRQNFEAQSTP